VFTGGIGENSAAVRASICSGLEWAGLRIDAERNEKAIGVEAEISAEIDDMKSALRAYVIPTDEELLMAHDTVRVVEGVQSKGS
jgi:acetate kinase